MVTTMTCAARSPFGRRGAAFGFFRDPIGYLDTLFGTCGRLVLVDTPAMATAPRRDYPGTVYLYGPDLLQRVSMAHDAYHRVPMSLSLYPQPGAPPRQEPVTRIMTGLPLLRGDEHRRQRRLMMPALHGNSVRQYHAHMVSATQEMLNGWTLDERIDLSAQMLRLMMRISAVTLFGGQEVAKGERLGYVVEEWIKFVMSLGHLLPYDRRGFPYRRWLDLSAEIQTATRALIAEKRASGASDNSLLSMLIRARDDQGSTLSEDDLTGHISLLLWGSRDATVYGVVWTVFLLSQHPLVLADVVDELDATLGGAAPAPHQLEQLPMLDRVIKESLRLLPPFPVIHRVSTQDNDLAGNLIAAGSEIVMSVYHTHRAADVYPHPLAFDPDRWLSTFPSPFQYVPFGGGPRSCPGSSFALQEMRVVVAMLLQRYRFEFIPGTRIDRRVEVTLTPRGGMPFMVRRPDHQFRRGTGDVRGNIHQMLTLRPRATA